MKKTSYQHHTLPLFYDFSFILYKRIKDPIE